LISWLAILSFRGKSRDTVPAAGLCEWTRSILWVKKPLEKSISLSFPVSRNLIRDTLIKRGILFYKVFFRDPFTINPCFLVGKTFGMDRFFVEKCNSQD
jgi:hypothetical protein